MKTLTTLASLGLLSLATALTACASSTASESAPGSTASQASVAEGPAELSGTWAFALGASDVAAPLKERCTRESGDDATRSKACWDEIVAQAATEKIRFTRDAAGHTLWTSFESDGAKESVYVEVPVELAHDGPGQVLAKIAGSPKGEHAARFAQGRVEVMRIEVVDARTIAMTDPKKGRLVYTKE